MVCEGAFSNFRTIQIFRSVRHRPVVSPAGRCLHRFLCRGLTYWFNDQRKFRFCFYQLFYRISGYYPVQNCSINRYG